MCSIIGVGERLHKVLGQNYLGTLDSGERSLPFGLLVVSLVTSALYLLSLKLVPLSEYMASGSPLRLTIL